MATVRTVTVKSSGGDYTSLSSAEAGEQGNLVSLDRQLNIECYASAAGDSTQVRVDGWTTDSTRYIDIYCPTGERHAGTWDTAKYHLTLTTSGSPGGCITNAEDYTRIRYLQVRNTRSSPPQYNSCIYSAANGTLIDGCITRGGYAGIDTDTSGHIVRNCVSYEGIRGGGNNNTSGGNTWQNCTLIGTTSGLASNASTTYPTASNVYAHGGTYGFSDYLLANAGGTMNKTNCMSSDTSSTSTYNGSTPTNCTNSVAHSTANFTNVTSTTENYLLPSGSALIDAGVDLSGTFTNDIDGTTRPQNSAFDVGADEYVAAAGGQPTWKRFGGVAFSARGMGGVW